MHETNATISLPRTLLRGLRMRCPRCGAGHIFERFFRPRTTRDRCELDLARGSAATAIVLTLPLRKGAAIALNYFIEIKTGIGAPDGGIP